MKRKTFSKPSQRSALIIIQLKINTIFFYKKIVDNFLFFKKNFCKSFLFFIPQDTFKFFLSKKKSPALLFEVCGLHEKSNDRDFFFFLSQYREREASFFQDTAPRALARS
ncbi:MAG TPA: hypothetical protein VFM02_01685 [Candidatus Paceibacterota bacterium]|nr:hypothetical protein [Candidatus Paceibacterota bacterium]